MAFEKVVFFRFVWFNDFEVYSDQKWRGEKRVQLTSEAYNLARSKEKHYNFVSTVSILFFKLSLSFEHIS